MNDDTKNLSDLNQLTLDELNANPNRNSPYSNDLFQDLGVYRLALYDNYNLYPSQLRPNSEKCAKYFDEKAMIMQVSSSFDPKEYYLYHGTSLEALDHIIDDRTMYTAAYLRDRDRLVWGELKRDFKEEDLERRGPKYMHPSIMRKLGIELSPEDEMIFGHAFALFFAAHPLGCFGYTPDDQEQQAIVVINKNAMEIQGYTFVDCKSEGIKVEGNVSLDFGLAALLVPSSKVELYKSKVSNGGLFTSVYNIDDVKSK